MCKILSQPLLKPDILYSIYTTLTFALTAAYTVITNYTLQTNRTIRLDQSLLVTRQSEYQKLNISQQLEMIKEAKGRSRKYRQCRITIQHQFTQFRPQSTLFHLQNNPTLPFLSHKITSGLGSLFILQYYNILVTSMKTRIKIDITANATDADTTNDANSHSRTRRTLQNSVLH